MYLSSNQYKNGIQACLGFTTLNDAYNFLIHLHHPCMNSSYFKYDKALYRMTLFLNNWITFGKLKSLVFEYRYGE